MKLIDFVINNTDKYIRTMPKAMRKKYGQFFTSKETAMFMAELFDISQNKSELKILDPGAGSGILSVALIERLQNIDNIKNINLICYENDANIIELLRTNLEWVCTHSKINLRYTINTKNYITSQAKEYNKTSNCNQISPKFDIVIGNPPI